MIQIYRTQLILTNGELIYLIQRNSHDTRKARMKKDTPEGINVKLMLP